MQASNDRHSTLLEWLEWLLTHSSQADVDQWITFLAQHQITQQELASARIDFLMRRMDEAMQSGDRARLDAAIERLSYNEQEQAFAQAQWQQVRQPKPKSNVVVPDPMKFGGQPKPDTKLSDEVHQLGSAIASVATRFKAPIIYQSERSRKAIRVKRLSFTPGSDTDASKVKALKDNLVLHAGMHPDASILIVPGAIEIHDPIPGDEWDRPHFKTYVKRPSKLEFPNYGIPYTVGIDLKAESLRRKVSALLISGYRGSGKSQHLLSLLTEVSYCHSPNHVQFALFDVCGATLSEFVDSPWMFQSPCLNDESFDPQMTKVLNCARGREALFASKQVNDIEAWNRKFPNKPLPRIVVVVEEFGETVARVGHKTANAVLASLARANRKQGFDIIICTQVANKEDFHKDLLRNLADRVVFQASDMGASYEAFGYNDDIATTLQGKGDGFLKYGSTPIRFQSLYLGDDNGAKLIHSLNAWGVNEYGQRDIELDEWQALEEATRPDPTLTIDKQRYQLIQQYEPDFKSGALTKTQYCLLVFADEGHTPKSMTGTTLTTRMKWIDGLKECYG